MLNIERTQHFKQVILEKWEGLYSGINTVMDDKIIQLETFPDPVDRATSETARTFSILLMDRKYETIRQIRSTIERMDNGTYGICEECGEEITEGRLEIMPETTLCLQCKKEQEFVSRLVGG